MVRLVFFFSRNDKKFVLLNVNVVEKLMFYVEVYSGWFTGTQ